MKAVFINAFLWYFPRSTFATLGILWLVLEPIIGLTGKSINITCWQLFGLSVAFGFVWFLVDGIYLTGFLKQSLEITSSGFDTKIIIKFGDIFQQNGWKAIAVNDFFDSIVDDRHVSKKTLHGLLLQKFWPGNIEDWNRQVDERLSGERYTPEVRDSGKQKRYQIGTCAEVKKDGAKFICVALSKTNISNLEVKSNSIDLLNAVHGVLKKARSVCAGQPLSIPLFGSGLSRVGIKYNILVDLILTAIFEETKANKVTNEIRIILPKDKLKMINLTTLKKDWS